MFNTTNDIVNVIDTIINNVIVTNYTDINDIIDFNNYSTYLGELMLTIGQSLQDEN